MTTSRGGKVVAKRGNLVRRHLTFKAFTHTMYESFIKSSRALYFSLTHIIIIVGTH